jgi:tetratricopeptide (TPR) repeat protein
MEDVRESSQRALMAAEGAVALALLFAPLALGTVQYWSLGVVVALASVGAIAAAIARPMRVRWPTWAAFALTAFVGLQAVPLPPWLLRFLSPSAAETIEQAAGTLGWHAISLDPSATAREFARLFAYSAIFFATARVVAENESSTRRFARLIAVALLIECAVAVAQKAVDAHQIYGVVPVTMQNNSILGTFGNPNHLAAYLTLGIPLLAMIGMRSSDALTRRLCWLGALGAGCLIVLTLSRSGMIGLAAATVTLLVLTRSEWQEMAAPMTWKRVAVGIVGIGVVLGIVVRWLEPRRSAKLAVLFHPARLLDEEKVQLWRDLPAMLHDFGRAGIGRGSFEEVLPAYKLHADWMTFSHVECGPLQALVDLGLLVGVALIVAWAVALVQAARREGMLLRMGAVAGLVGVTLHDLADFSLEGAGAVGLTAAVLWGLAAPAARSRSARRTVLPIVAVGAVAASIALWSGWRGDLHRAISAVEAANKDPKRDLDPLLKEAILRHPAEPWFEYMAGVNDIRQRRPGVALHHLGRAVGRDPKNWRYHEGIGIALWRLGRRSQSLLEFRIAYVAAHDYDAVVDTVLAQPGADAARDLLQMVGEDASVAEGLAGYLERHPTDKLPALVLARRALEIDPTRSASRRMLARADASQKKWNEVLRDVEGLGDPDATLLRVAALEGLGRATEAETLLDGAIAASPAPALALAGAERALLRHDDRALQLLNGIDESGLHPDELARLHRLRAAFFAQGKHSTEEINELIVAARVDPTEANRLELGAAYERAGHRRAAILTYRELAKTSVEARTRLEKLVGAGEPSEVVGGSGAAVNPEIDDLDDPGGGEQTDP